VRQVRHGAATALRELLRTHAACAAVAAPVDAAAETGWALSGGAGKRRLAAPPEGAAAAVGAAAAARAAWLQECSALLLAVLALDRFADYVSDQARIAPVGFMF
jgi:TATA-binding protein-associated factor